MNENHFYLTKHQKSVWALYRNVISFHLQAQFHSKYSETNQFKKTFSWMAII